MTPCRLVDRSLADDPTTSHHPDMTAINPRSRLLSILQDIREDLVRISATLERYEAARAAAPPELWTDVKSLVEAEIDAIERRLARVTSLIEEHDDLAEVNSYAVTRIENLWADITQVWKSMSNTQPQLAMVRRDIDQCVLEIAYLTVPERADRVLKSLRVGGTMNFHQEFLSEIPSERARTTLLKWLNTHPRLVRGVVDVPSGSVIKASGSASRRAQSWLMVLAVMTVALVSAGFAPELLGLTEVGKVPPGSGTDYVWAVLFAYAGAVAHVGIAAMKQLRRSGADDDQRFTAIGNFAIWVHINEMYLVMYALAIPVVAYAVILSTGQIDNFTMAFVGFSIDSLLDVVLSRFDKATAGRTETIAASVP